MSTWAGEHFLYLCRDRSVCLYPASASEGLVYDDFFLPGIRCYFFYLDQSADSRLPPRTFAGTPLLIASPMSPYASLPEAGMSSCGPALTHSDADWSSGRGLGGAIDRQALGSLTGKPIAKIPQIVLVIRRCCL